MRAIRIDNILSKLDMEREISASDGYYLIGCINDLYKKIEDCCEYRWKTELKIERLQKQIKKLKGVK